MIVDTSALIAILRDEPEAMSYARAIEMADARRVSAANFVEAALVIDSSRDPIASRRFDDLCRTPDHRAGDRSSGQNCTGSLPGLR
jgi:ribonuclease VapC